MDAVVRPFLQAYYGALGARNFRLLSETYESRAQLNIFGKHISNRDDIIKGLESCPLFDCKPEFSIINYSTQEYKSEGHIFVHVYAKVYTNGDKDDRNSLFVNETFLLMRQKDSPTPYLISNHTIRLLGTVPKK
ncbi:hypothetical protein ADUPG1_013715 [Aduncisulcus paluster]|uniref:NTF2 domain-containing protein n=1 Tax=Aduncisulcus paluster TaxID=2918883 RepID=A0ABQ5K3V2_9EUKA|nr:hypothetical protein ADUPG1_013715 [Aduncisulcus paluster]